MRTCVFVPLLSLSFSFLGSLMWYLALTSPEWIDMIKDFSLPLSTFSSVFFVLFCLAYDLVMNEWVYDLPWVGT